MSSENVLKQKEIIKKIVVFKHPTLRFLSWLKTWDSDWYKIQQYESASQIFVFLVDKKEMAPKNIVLNDPVVIRAVLNDNRRRRKSKIKIPKVEVRKNERQKSSKRPYTHFDKNH